MFSRKAILGLQFVVVWLDLYQGLVHKFKVDRCANENIGTWLKALQ